MRDRIETAEITDAELDNVSGGVGVSLDGLANVDVTPGPGGVAASVNGALPQAGGLSGTLNVGMPAIEGSNGVVA